MNNFDNQDNNSKLNFNPKKINFLQDNIDNINVNINNLDNISLSKNLKNEFTTINTTKAVDNFIRDYFENEDIIGTNFNDISNQFLDIVDKMDVKKLNFPSDEFDIVFSGGGLKGYYNFGAAEIIKKLMANKQIKIRNYIGVSVGAYVAVFLLMGISIHSIRSVYEFARSNKKKHDLNKIILKACDKLLPDDAHTICNGKVKIVVSQLTVKGMVPVIIDHFNSKEHLMKVLHATSFIPFFTSNNMSGIEIDGKTYYDGAFTNNLPINLTNDIPKLVFLTSKVEYSPNYMFKILDRCPELLILRGAIEMEKFILHKFHKSYHKDISKIPIHWIVSKKDSSLLKKSNTDTLQIVFLNILHLISLILCSVNYLLTSKEIFYSAKSYYKSVYQSIDLNFKFNFDFVNLPNLNNYFKHYSKNKKNKKIK